MPVHTRARLEVNTDFHWWSGRGLDNYLHFFMVNLVVDTLFKFLQGGFQSRFETCKICSLDSTFQYQGLPV